MHSTHLYDVLLQRLSNGLSMLGILSRDRRKGTDVGPVNGVQVLERKAVIVRHFSGRLLLRHGDGLPQHACGTSEPDRERWARLRRGPITDTVATGGKAALLVWMNCTAPLER